MLAKRNYTFSDIKHLPTRQLLEIKLV